MRILDHPILGRLAYTQEVEIIVDGKPLKAREGEPIADPLRRSGLFPPVVVQMVAVGEKSGELEKMLLKISDSFDRTVETRITGLMALLEPVIILVMGLIIGFVVIAIMLPMLEMSSGVR